MVTFNWYPLEFDFTNTLCRVWRLHRSAAIDIEVADRAIQANLFMRDAMAKQNAIEENLRDERGTSGELSSRSTSSADSFCTAASLALSARPFVPTYTKKAEETTRPCIKVKPSSNFWQRFKDDSDVDTKPPQQANDTAKMSPTEAVQDIGEDELKPAADELVKKVEAEEKAEEYSAAIREDDSCGVVATCSPCIRVDGIASTSELVRHWSNVIQNHQQTVAQSMQVYVNRSHTRSTGKWWQIVKEKTAPLPQADSAPSFHEMAKSDSGCSTQSMTAAQTRSAGGNGTVKTKGDKIPATRKTESQPVSRVSLLPASMTYNPSSSQSAASVNSQNGDCPSESANVCNGRESGR